ncbi:dihydrodipicolinate synthase family protein [Herbiconiux sp. YIM B11900]|uniref:dihydrodipicolinate synthase family protein n=1 Tax=Herbiconiux sp. YIM B11900 TaxID=3404131 RepID=UPI003F863497
MSYTPMSGIYTALVTPFFEDERLDLDGFGRLVDDQVDGGVAGLVVNGSTGEFPSLTTDERRASVEAVTEASAGRAEVIVGIGAMTTREAQEHAEHAAAAGAKAGLLVMPYYEPLSDDELSGFVADIASVGLPLMIYNNPGGTGVSLTPEFINELSLIENVVSIKDTTPELSRLFAIDLLTEGRLDVLSGHDSSTIYAFLTGRDAAVWGAPNAHPAACVTLWRLAREGRASEALRLWKDLYPLQAFLESHNYMASTKAGANIRGVSVGQPRKPILPLPEDDRAELAAIIERLDDVIETFNLTTSTASLA